MNKNTENPAVLEQVAEGIVETSSEFHVTKHVLRMIKRKKAATRRAARKRAVLNKKGNTSIEAPTKMYTVLVQYHQLNYAAIQEELKANGLTPTVIDNKHFWLNHVDAEKLEILKQAMRKCHFKTKGGKEYKVRLAAYKDIHIRDAAPIERKQTGNKPEVAAAAKKKRKTAKKKVFDNRGRHLLGRKANKKSHKPGVLDTSSLSKKLRERVKKAVKASVRAERDRATQAKSRANKAISQPISKKREGKQLELAA